MGGTGNQRVEVSDQCRLSQAENLVESAVDRSSNQMLWNIKRQENVLE